MERVKQKTWKALLEGLALVFDVWTCQSTNYMFVSLLFIQLRNKTVTASTSGFFYLNRRGALMRLII